LILLHRLQTQIEIDATPERVRAVLMDFAAYPGWNPFIRSIAGAQAVGERLTVRMQPPGGRAMTFRTRVIASTPREFRWKGHLLVPGLFDGEHYFQIESGASSRITFHHGETFTGILVPLFRRSLDDATRRGFIAMNEALKQEAERRG
jgi:hypothetical protein